MLQNVRRPIRLRHDLCDEYQLNGAECDDVPLVYQFSPSVAVLFTVSEQTDDSFTVDGRSVGCCDGSLRRSLGRSNCGDRARCLSKWLPAIHALLMI